jgi:hypothetical protein
MDMLYRCPIISGSGVDCRNDAWLFDVLPSIVGYIYSNQPQSKESAGFFAFPRQWLVRHFQPNPAFDV